MLAWLTRLHPFLWIRYSCRNHSWRCQKHVVPMMGQLSFANPPEYVRVVTNIIIPFTCMEVINQTVFIPASIVGFISVPIAKTKRSSGGHPHKLSFLGDVSGPKPVSQVPLAVISRIESSCFCNRKGDVSVIYWFSFVALIQGNA